MCITSVFLKYFWKLQCLIYLMLGYIICDSANYCYCLCPGLYNELEKYSIWIYPSSGRDSAVGVVTHYGLDGPGIESQWGARFSAPVQTGPGAYPASSTMDTGSFPRVKRPGRGADNPPSSKCRGQERVGMYLYSPSGLSWSVMGAPLPLPVIDPWGIGCFIVYVLLIRVISF